jgi:hypothetical protein
LDDEFKHLYSSVSAPSSSATASLLDSLSGPLKQYTGFDLGTVTKWDNVMAPDTVYKDLAVKLH